MNEKDKPDPEPDDEPEVDQSNTSSVKGDTVLDPFVGTGMVKRKVGGRVPAKIEGKVVRKVPAKIEGKVEADSGGLKESQKFDDDEIQRLVNDINSGVTTHPTKRGRLKFKAERILNKYGTEKYQRPYSIGDLSSEIPQSGAKNKEEWKQWYLDGNVIVNRSVEDVAEYHPTAEGKYRCALCNYGHDDKGRAYGTMRIHTKKHPVKIDSDHLDKTAMRMYEHIMSDASTITLEITRLYMNDVIINRTWDGHIGEIKVVEYIEEELDKDEDIDVPEDFKIQNTEGVEDSAGMVDRFIPCMDGDIGLQIKPKDSATGPDTTGTDATNKHQEWKEKRGGEVFWPKYVEDDDGILQPAKDSKLMKNIIDEIKRLGGLRIIIDEEE